MLRSDSQGWLTEDHTTLLLDDELDEHKRVTPEPGTQGQTITYLWDVSYLTRPVLKRHHISSEIAIDHNQYILGDLTYQVRLTDCGLMTPRGVIEHGQRIFQEANELTFWDSDGICVPNP